MTVIAPPRSTRHADAPTRRRPPSAEQPSGWPAGAPGTAGRHCCSGCCSSPPRSSAAALAGTRLLTDGETGAGESGRADRAIEQAGYPADLTERVLIQAPRGTDARTAEARAVAGELRTRLVGAARRSPTVGALVRADDGRSALLPVRARRRTARPVRRPKTSPTSASRRVLAATADGRRRRTRT